MGFSGTVFGFVEINHSASSAHIVVLKWHFCSLLCYIECCNEKSTTHIVNCIVNFTLTWTQWFRFFSGGTIGAGYF